MGADFYESPADLMLSGVGLLPVGIGDESTIEGAIVDKNCRIGPGAKIINQDKIEDGNLGDFCLIRDGILTVEKGACLPPGWNA